MWTLNTCLCLCLSLCVYQSRVCPRGNFAPAQSPVCTRKPTKLLWRNVGWSCPWITIWKLVPALTTQHIMCYTNLTQPQESCIFRGQMEKEEWPTPGTTHWSQSRGSHDLCREWRRNGLLPEDTNLSARNTWIRSKETQPHWRGEHMYDHKRRGSGQIQRVSRCSRSTW